MSHVLPQEVNAMIGSRLSNRYEIVAEIGRGGMGVVYHARDPILDRDVAIKMLPPGGATAEAVERFRREMRTVGQLDHPSIVQVHDSGVHEGALFFVMPLVRGKSLRALMSERSLTLGATVDVAVQVADALEYSHSSGVVHRDIKPENVLVAVDPSGLLRARITDFGLAMAAAQDRLTRTGALIGTVAYLSPEQVTGDEVDARSDIYSLGTVLYEALVGDTPFAGDVHSVLYRIANEAPVPPRMRGATIDEDIDAIVMQCLEKSKVRRIQHARDLSHALCAYRARLTEADDNRIVVGAVPAHRMFTVRAGPFVGRSQHLAESQRRLTMAEAGECQLMIVAGEAGTGKSRLLEEIEKAATARKIRVLHGRFVAQDQSFAFQGFCEAIQEYFRWRTASGSQASGSRPSGSQPVGSQPLGSQPVGSQPVGSQPSGSDFSDLAPELAAVFPALAEIGELRAGRRASTDPSVVLHPPDRAAVFELLSRTLARIGNGQPLVMLLEELHSADVSVEALAHVARRLGATPTLLVGTYRPSEIDRSHPLHAFIQSFRGDRRFALLQLEPFSSEEHRALLEALLGSPMLEDRLVRTIFEVTEGNPLFTSEVVRSLTDSGRLTRSSTGLWRLIEEPEAAQIPATIQQTVERRISRMSAPLLEVFGVAAVMGKRFVLDHLLQLAGGGEKSEDAVDELLRSGFLSEEPGSRGDRLVFSSGILRDVLYQSLPRRRRRALHRAYAELLERHHAGRLARVYPQLLYHYSEGDVSEKVVEYGLCQARSALHAFSHEDAARAARTVLEFIEEGDPRQRRQEAEARTLSGIAYRLDGRIDEALREIGVAVLIAEEIGDEAFLAATLLAAAETAWEGRRAEEARRWAERGIAIARGDPSLPELASLLTLAATLANMRGDTGVGAGYQEEIDRLQPAPVDGAAVGRGGIVHVPTPQLLNSLDPALCFTIIQAEVLPTVFETLCRATGGARIVPWLAAEIRSEDGGRAYRIRLREDVRFHDGRRLTARDARFSFERLMRCERAESRWLLNCVRGATEAAAGAELTGVRIENEKEFVVELVEPLAYFPAILTFPAFSIVPEGFGTGDDLTDPASVSGTGPFRVRRFEPGRRLELESNPTYWRRGYPRANGIAFSFGVPPEDILARFRAGEFSLAWDLHPADVEMLRHTPEYASRYRETPRLTTYYIALNAHHGPLASGPARQAVVTALDVPDLVGRTVGRQGVRATGFIPPGLLARRHDRRPAWSDPIPQREPARLKALLNSAYRGPYADLAREIFAMLQHAGFPVDIVDTRSEYASNQALALAQADIVLTRWNADYPDAESFAGLLHSETGLLGKLIGTTEIDRLIVQGRTESDPMRRQDTYCKIEELLSDRALLIPLFYEQSYCFARPEVQNYEINLFWPVAPYEKLWVKT